MLRKIPNAAKVVGELAMAGHCCQQTLWWKDIAIQFQTSESPEDRVIIMLTRDVVVIWSISVDDSTKYSECRIAGGLKESC